MVTESQQRRALSASVVDTSSKETFDLNPSSRITHNNGVQNDKMKMALLQPNIVARERSFYRPRQKATAISVHPKFATERPPIEGSFLGQSPYRMENVDENKYHMSGYMGFVPRYRFLVGAGYPILTHEAMNEFTDCLKVRRMVLTDPISTEMVPSLQLPRLNTKRTVIYPSEGGIIPNYMGHVPGHKFRFGHTFGQITRNARRLSMSAR